MRPLDPSTFLAETLKPYATGERPGLPDLLARYLLEPGDVDIQAIMARLAEVKVIWDKNQEHPRYGNLARRLTSEHDDASLELCDPRSLARLADEARRAQQEKADKTAAALKDWRAVLAEHVAKGGLTPNTRATLEDLALKASLDPHVVRAELDAAPVAAKPDQLSEEQRRQIRRYLQELAREVGEERLSLSLFHALGLEGITTDVAEIRRQYSAEDSRTRGISHGAVATAYKNVLASAKLYLLEGDARAYVEGLIEDITAELQLDGARVGADGVIDPTEAESLMQSAVRRGLPAELARRVVTELARQNDAVVQVAETVDYVSCPACNTPHPRPAAPGNCKRCGVSLFIDCPADGCGTRNDATSLRCVGCGTDLHQYAEATRRVTRLPAALDEGRLAWVDSEILEISRVLGANAIPRDLRARVDQKVADAEALWRSAETAIAGRRLYEARTVLIGLGKGAKDVLGPTGETPEARLREIEQRLTDVDAALARARTLTGVPREAELVRAVELAQDCSEAAGALAAIPPKPPVSVRVTLDSAGPLVEWSRSATAGAHYRVSRVEAQSGGRVQLTEGQNTRCEDPDAPVGMTVRYEIVTVRGEATSSPLLSDPILVAREIQDLRVADSDAEVALSWRPVPATAQVVIRRTSGEGGAAVEIAADRAGAVDRDVTNGTRYAYLVAVEYAAGGGETRRTAGVTIFGQPAAAPDGIRDLDIRPMKGGVEIRYERPASGTVTILRSAEAPSLEEGDRLSPDELDGIGRVVPQTGGAAHDDASGQVCWYVPVTLAGGIAVAGRPHRHLAMPEISNVSLVEQPGQVKVTWSWPDGVRLARVVWRHDRQPTGGDDPGSDAAWVRLGEYRDNGGFTIDARGAASLFVAVLPAARVEGELIAGTILTKGSRAAIRPAEKADVRYRVRRSGMRKKRLDVEVDIPPGVSAPGLVFVARPGDLLPRSAGEGDIVARLGAGGPLTSSVDLSAHPRPLAVRLFLESSSSAGSFQLFDPAVDELLIK